MWNLNSLYACRSVVVPGGLWVNVSSGNGIKTPQICLIIVHCCCSSSTLCWNYHHHYQPHYTNGGALPLILIQAISRLWHHQSSLSTAKTRRRDISIIMPQWQNQQDDIIMIVTAVMLEDVTWLRQLIQISGLLTNCDITNVHVQLEMNMSLKLLLFFKLS